MGLKDRLGRLAGRLGSTLQDRVGGFVEDTLMADAVKRQLIEVEQDLAHGLLDEADRKLSHLEAQRSAGPRVKVLRGVVSLHQGDAVRAANHLEAALNQRQSVEAFYFLALAFEQQQRWADARNALLAALGTDREPPMHFELRFALGRVYLATGRLDRATRELHRALKLRPGDEETLTMLAVVLRQQNQEAEALQTLREAAVLEGLQRAASWALLGQLEAGQNLDAAKRAFGRALALDPNQREALEGAASCALEQGQVEEAHGYLKRLRASGGSARFLEGRLATVEGDDDEAVKAFAEVLEATPGHVGALLAAGRVALHQGFAETASGYFGRALEALPGSAEALRGAARARLALGDALGAMRLVERLKAKGGSGGEGGGVGDALLFGEAARMKGALLEALAYAQDALGVDAGEVSGGEGRDGGRDRVALEALRAAVLQEVLPEVVWPGGDEWGASAGASAWAESLAACVVYMRAEPLLHPWLGVMAQLQAELESPLRVAIMGEFNAGKSTWINAYLGEDVVPTGVLPTTAHLNQVRYGARRAARVMVKQGGGGAGPHEVREVAFEAVKGELARWGEERVERVDFLYPHPQLRRVNLVDTPGFNAVNEAHEVLARQALSEADAILWLIDANQALSETQRQVLAKVEGGQEKTLIVLNKIDSLEAEERAAVLGFLQQHTQGLARGVVSVSALRALRAQQQALREGWDASELAKRLEDAGWSALLQTLDAELIDRSARLKVDELRRRLARVVADISATVTTQDQRLAALMVQLVQGGEGFGRSRAQIVSRVLPDEHDRLQEQLSLILTVVAREVEDARRPSAGWLSPLTLDVEDMAHVLGLLRARIQQALSRSEHRIQHLAGDAISGLVETLAAVARALPPTQGRLIMDRLERFMAQEHLLLQRLRASYEQTLQHLDGRLWLPTHDPAFARALGDEGVPESDRKQTLDRWVGDLSSAILDALRAWVQAYFDASAALCDNVRRDVEQMRLALKYRVWHPFAPLHLTKSATPGATPLPPLAVEEN